MLAALATEREAAAANLAPGLIQTSLGGSLRGIGGSRLVADERPRQPAKPLVTEDLLDAADPRSLPGQGGEDLDIAAGQQRRPRGVSRADRDRGVPAAFGDERLGMEPLQGRCVLLLAIFRGRHFVEHGHAGKAIERGARHLGEFVGSPDEDRLFGAGQTGEHRQGLIVAEGRDYAQPNAGFRAPWLSAEAIDGEGDALERFGQAPFGAAHVFGQVIDKRLRSVGNADGREVGELAKEVGERAVDGFGLPGDHAIEGGGDVP